MIPEVLTHLWQSTVFAIVAALFAFAFRHHKARVRFSIWLSASLKFFLPFALLMSIGSHLQRPTAVAQIATPAVVYAVDYVAQPFTPSVQIRSGAPPARSWIVPAILFLWAAGCLAAIAIRLRLWLRIQATLRASKPVDIPGQVIIRSASGLLEPGVVGLLNPVLLLPEGILERLTSSEFEAVMAHELCHIRRRDNLFATLHMVIEVVFWFHPLVWWIGARMVEERERACDEEVLILGNQPQIYAGAIVSVCRAYLESPLDCVAGVTGSDIKRRIEAIMENRNSLNLKSAGKFVLATTGVAAIAVPILFGLIIGVGRIPVIYAQSHVAAPPALPIAAQVIQQPQPTPSATQATPATPQDRRLIVMLFDLSSMTADEQSVTQAAGLAYVQNTLKPGDLVTVMVAAASVEVLQDFTDNPALLRAAIQKIITEGGKAVTPAGGRMETLATTIRMLRGFPEKKAIVYFSLRAAQSDDQDQAQLKALIIDATKANVAIFPIDPRPSGPGSASTSPLPNGISQEEYDRRAAYAQAKFGALNGAMSRSYIRYGPPDQIDTPAAGTSQIWRYKYLQDFQGGAAFEFDGNGPRAGRIVYPPPSAIFHSEALPVPDIAILTKGLPRTGPESGTFGPLGGAPASLQILPAMPGTAPAADRKIAFVSVPLATLSGKVNISGKVTSRPEGRMVAAVSDSAAASSGSFECSFTLSPGSYTFAFVYSRRGEVTFQPA